SRGLEKRIGKEARRQIHASKGLSREYKIFRTTWRSRLNRNRASLGVVYAIVCIAAFCLYAVDTHPNAVPLAASVAIPAYSIGTALARSRKFHMRVLASFDRVFFLHLPVTDEEFLNWEWQEFLKSWTKALLVFMPAFGFVAASTSGWNWPRIRLSLVCGVLQTGSALTLGLMVLATQPRWAKFLTAAPFYLLIGLAVWKPELIARTLALPLGVLPVGWIPFTLMQPAIWNRHLLLWPMLAAATFAGLSVIFARRVHSIFLAELAKHAEFRTPDLETSQGEVGQGELPSPETTAKPSDTLEPVVAERRAMGREYLEPINLASAGWVEWLGGHILSAEDFRVLEFIFGGTLPQWSKLFKTAVVVAAVGLASTFVTALPVWTGFVGALIASMLAAPVAGGQWGVFAREFRSGFAIPMYIAGPIGFDRIWSVVLKMNLLRIACWTPIITLYGAVLARRIGGDPWSGAVNTAKAILVLTLLQPVMILWKYSQGTNDTRRVSRQIVLALPLALLLVAGFVTALVAFCVASAAWAQILGVLGMMACSLLLYSGYMFLLTRGRIDLLSAPGS
ncbi:MAG TPA: hypothetical protein VG498_19595, partial [Terriglobales bacterium]|nr:hypothetical protein [Terriglobales bacterium]